jgi:hypothetical protein
MYAPGRRRHASQFGLAPVVVERSQSDWFRAEDWTLASTAASIGSVPLRHPIKRCGPGAPTEKRDGARCHLVREPDSQLAGRAFAALRAVNLTDLGLETYGDLLATQVRVLRVLCVLQ